MCAFEFGARERAFEDEDRRADAGRAQLDCFVDEGDGKGIGHRFEGAGAGHAAVAVGICLEHGDRAPAVQAACGEIVVPQRLEIDAGVSRPGHADTPAGRPVGDSAGAVRV